MARLLHAAAVNSTRNVLVVILFALLAVFIGVPLATTPEEVPGTAVADSPQPPPGSPSAPPDSTRAAPPRTRTESPALPSRAVLLKPVIFPVQSRGRVLGKVTAQAGVAVDVVADRGANVVVRLVNSHVSVPRELLALPEPLEIGEPGVSQSVRTTAQRIVDYWFTRPEPR